MSMYDFATTNTYRKKTWPRFCSQKILQFKIKVELYYAIKHLKIMCPCHYVALNGKGIRYC
jgi:hypothetical protein